MEHTVEQATTEEQRKCTHEWEQVGQETYWDRDQSVTFSATCKKCGLEAHAIRSTCYWIATGAFYDEHGELYECRNGDNNRKGVKT